MTTISIIIKIIYCENKNGLKNLVKCAIIL